MFRERISSSILVITMVLVIGSIAWSARALTTHRVQNTTVFNLTGVGASGVWTLEPVSGLNYWWKTFQPATLFVTTGDEVVVHLRSADVFHRFYLPEFGIGPVDVEPGHTTTVRFTATHSGVVQYYCTSMCGTCHFFMRGWVVVTDPGEEPPVPPPLVCGLCLPPSGPVSLDDGLVDAGAELYERKGCFTCHGPEGRGGNTNFNSTIGAVPPHDTTAQKFFIQTPEDADAFIEIVEQFSDLEEADGFDVSAFPVVCTRFENAKEIVRTGRFTAKANPLGPQPPLQMPAWEHLLNEREIDALLVYFVSLYDWDEEDAS